MADVTRDRLLLLDGHSLAYRAFYALPAENFKTQGGLTTNAVYGFTAMLINLLRDEQPSHIAAAFDVSRQTFRVDKYPEYKAGRSSTPDEFRGQIDITKEVLVALGITVLAEPGFEADDIIATLATQAEDDGYRVLVVTGDRDSLQLVSQDVTVLYPRKGVSELTRFTPEAVLEKYSGDPEAATYGEYRQRARFEARIHQKQRFDRRESDDQRCGHEPAAQRRRGNGERHAHDADQ